MTESHAKRDRIARRLKWLVLFGATLLMAGVLVASSALLGTSDWMIEFASKSEAEFLEPENNDRWWSLVEAANKRETLGFAVLLPLGFGTLLESVISLACVSKGRFSLRSLLIGVLYLNLLIGIPLGLIRPRLQNPQFECFPAFGTITLSQHRDPASNVSLSVFDRNKAIVAALPLLVLPIIFFWPARTRRVVSQRPDGNEGRP